jgi:phosphatidylglycerol lysyltransferase
MSIREPPRRVVDLALERGRDAMSFLAVESGMLHWFDADAPEGTGACVAYVDTQGAWVAACSPLVPSDPDAQPRELARAASRFAEAARRRGRRACFFGSEAPEVDGFSRMLVGEQPFFRPREWLEDLAWRRRLREQLRRARAKGLDVRVVPAHELAAGLPLRFEVERLAGGWLGARHIEPMTFLVALEPFHCPEEHRYLVAEVGGRAVGFLSAVPIGRRQAWLVEDVVRSATAPNGTTESLIVALMREVRDSEYVTLGLTPLCGAVPWPLRVVRWVSRPLFDFDGIRAFRERMHPTEWHPVWLLYPRETSSLCSVLDSLRAFAKGSLVAFAARSFARHPSGLPWVLALPLPLWTLGLAWLVIVHQGSLLGFHEGALAMWTAFDAALLVILVRAAMRPLRSRLALATALGVVDAALSLAHLARVGVGSTILQATWRGLATIGPVVGTLLLAWATTRTTAGRRPSS